MLVCPDNVQKNEETGLAWHLKDEVMRRGRVYYAKLASGRSMFAPLCLISHFAAVWMPRRKDEALVLSDAAQRVLKVLRRGHELATADLRALPTQDPESDQLVYRFVEYRRGRRGV